MEPSVILQINYQVARFLTLFERLVLALEKIAAKDSKHEPS